MILNSAVPVSVVVRAVSQNVQFPNLAWVKPHVAGCAGLSVSDVMHTYICAQAVWLHTLSFLHTENIILCSSYYHTSLHSHLHTHVLACSDSLIHWIMNHNTSLVVLTTGKLCADEKFPHHMPPCHQEPMRAEDPRGLLLLCIILSSHICGCPVEAECYMHSSMLVFNVKPDSH